MACLLAGLGARDQMTVAGLAGRQSGRPGLLALALVTSFATAAFAAYAAIKIAPQLNGDARTIFAGIALVLAGGESLVMAPRRLPEEPTSSLGATAIVLLAHQLTDAARFLIFAIAVKTGAALWAGVGGALGGAAVVTLAWTFPEAFEWRNLRWVRRGIGTVLLLLGAWLILRAMGRI